MAKNHFRGEWGKTREDDEEWCTFIANSEVGTLETRNAPEGKEEV